MKHLEFVEIVPRDGFQSVKDFIDTEIKKEVIDRLVDAGVANIQLTSFVNPKAVPQMKDATKLSRYALARYKEVNFSALVPNLRGVQNAVEAGIGEVAYVISLSESHNQANVNRSVDASFEELEKVMELFPDLKMNLDVATAFGCPFEGESDLKDLMRFVERAVKLGVRDINLCDTIGVAYPKQVKRYVKELTTWFPEVSFGIHIHDTRNRGMLCTYQAIEMGIDKVYTVCSGLGGCPFAPGASGNTASEDLLHLLKLEGIDLGVDVDKMVETAKYIKEKVPTGNYSSHYLNI